MVDGDDEEGGGGVEFGLVKLVGVKVMVVVDGFTAWRGLREFVVGACCFEGSLVAAKVWWCEAEEDRIWDGG